MIIKCPACGQDVSDKAIRCNKCGEPINKDVATGTVARLSIPKTTLIIMSAAMLMGLFFSFREIKSNIELAKYVSLKSEMLGDRTETSIIMLEYQMDMMESFGIL